MASNLMAIWNNTQKRRLALVVLSGALIGAAFAIKASGGPLQAHDLLMTLAAIVAGSDIAIRAWHSLRNRHASIELLVTIAATGGLLIGEYWESAAVTFLFVFGAYLEARTIGRTRQVIEDLLDLAPATAVVLRNGRQEEVLAHEVAVGETVIVKPGVKVPVDGEVEQGRSTVNESAITGEPMPETKVEGDSVFAGSVNQHGLLYVRATGVGADTTLARIIHLVEEAQDQKAPTQRFIERFARWYTPLIIVMSAAVFVFTGNLERALTLLVIACPGALVISTPVSVVAGIGSAARKGILIKGGEYLERAGSITTVAMDKTGTLTEGSPQVTDVITMGESLPLPTLQLAAVGGDGHLSPSQGYQHQDRLPGNGRWDAHQDAALFWAAVAESGSEHPLADAIWHARDWVGQIPQADDFEALPGLGVRALWEGREIHIGSTALLAQMGIPIRDAVRREMERLQEDGKTAVLLSVDSEVRAVIGIADPLRDTAKELVQRLRSIGIGDIVMLTGDDQRTANAIAAEAGITAVHAGLLPHEKLEYINRLQDEGKVVAMVGDGVNDAPALVSSDVGIAMGAAGSDIAIEAAGITLMTDDLLKIPEAIRLSQAARRNIFQNVSVALAVVGLLVAGVLVGRVHMAGGMLVHEASVLLLILNGVRLLRK